MPKTDRNCEARALPRFPAALLRLLLPDAERDEVLADLKEEHRARTETSGKRAADAWVWRQVFASAPALAWRGWWRGWSMFEPRADRYRPGGAMFEGWGADLRYTLRRLRMRPTYALLTVLTLALGVSGTAAVYGIARPLLFERIPVADEEEVVAFWARFDWSQAEFLHVRPEIHGFRNVAAYRPADVTLQRGDEPARLLPGIAVTSEFLRVLGVSPALGAGFREGDDVLGADPVVVISHSLWRQLGGDPEIVGQRIELAGEARTVTGVMPEGFWFPDPSVQVWLAQHLDPESQSGNFVLVGRMPPGMGVSALAGELEHITTLLADRFEYPEQFDKTRDAELIPIRDYLVGRVRPALLAMLAAMGLLLGVASVNVAALMLGQVDVRGTELAVRSALGAGRERLLRQILLESLVIGGLAGLVGAGMAVLGFHFLLEALPLGTLAETASLDWTLFGAAIGFALAAASAVALVPGLSLGRSDLRGELGGSRAGGIAGRGGRLESVLVVGQVALVLLMASGAALLIRSVENMRTIDAGVETRGVAVIDIIMPGTTEPARRPLLLSEMVTSVETLPGVRSAASAQKIPLRGPGDHWGLVIEGQPDLGTVTTAFRMVTPDYFETMGIQVLSGRGMLPSDRVGGGEEGVIVINRALAERYFPDVDPLGQRVALDGWSRVVGVVENVAESNLTDAPVPARYMLYDHVPWIGVHHSIVMRVAEGQSPAAILSSARRVIQSTYPDVAVHQLTTMDRVFTQAIGPARQLMALLSLLGGLALALGTVGVYGVISHFVTRRRRDWGIRIALGLRPVDVVRQVVARGGMLVGGGILLGLAGFAVLGRLLSSFLYGVGTADPAALIGAAALLLSAGLFAAWIPAHRASRIDPALALRDQ